MHLKRQEVPKNWPIHRKSTKYVVRPQFDIKNNIPILVVVRDMLELAKDRKEVKRAIHLQTILVNGKIVRDEKNSVSLFDVITILPSKKNFIIALTENGKFKVKELTSKKTDEKIAKVINKKILKGKKIQINLSDGNNFLSEIKCSVNDSVLINLKDRKIEKCLPFNEKSQVIVFAGKHSGKTGVVEKINSQMKMIEMKTKEGKINVLIKQIMVIE